MVDQWLFMEEERVGPGDGIYPIGKRQCGNDSRGCTLKQTQLRAHWQGSRLLTPILKEIGVQVKCYHIAALAAVKSVRKRSFYPSMQQTDAVAPLKRVALPLHSQTLSLHPLPPTEGNSPKAHDFCIAKHCQNMHCVCVFLVKTFMYLE